MADIIPQLLVVTVVLNFSYSADSYCGLENCSLLDHFTKHGPSNSLRLSGEHPPPPKRYPISVFWREFWRSSSVFWRECSGESSGDQVQPCQLLLKVREVQGQRKFMVFTQQRKSSAEVDCRHRGGLSGKVCHAFFPEIPHSNSYFLISTD